MQQQILIEFINTLDAQLKKTLQEGGSGLAQLTISQFQYLDAIHALSNPAITEVAARLKITKASVTVGINKLIRLGYVTKTQSTQDRRVFHVHLTEAAQRLVQARYRALEDYGSSVSSALSAEESRQFEALLKKLVAYFAKENQGALLEN